MITEPIAHRQVVGEAAALRPRARVFLNHGTLPVGAQIIISHSLAPTYHEAIQEWELVCREDHPAVEFHPDHCLDAFGNRPQWIFRIVNRHTAVELLLGPNDIQSHGFLDAKSVNDLKAVKHSEIKCYQARLVLVRKYARFCQLTPEEENLLRLADFGDQQFPLITCLYLKIAAALQEKGYDLENETSFHDLFKTYEELEKANFADFFFSDEEIDSLTTLYCKYHEATELLTADEIELLNSLYQRLREFQNALQSSAGLWARNAIGQTYRFEDCLRAAAAWQANVYVANLYAERIRAGEIKNVVDFGAGNSALFQTLRDIAALPQGIMLDIERDKTASARAQNPLRLRASITQVPLASSVADLVSTVFVFTHLQPEQVRDAIANALHVLRPTGEIIIVLPESFSFDHNIFARGVTGLGGRVIGITQPTPNQLDSTEREMLRQSYGTEVLAIIERLLAKPFNVIQIKKKREISFEQRTTVSSNLFCLKRSRKRQSASPNGDGNGKSQPRGLRTDYLLALAYVSRSLKAREINVTPINMVPVAAVLEEHSDFNEKYANLRCLEAILPARTRTRLDRIAADCQKSRAMNQHDIAWLLLTYTEVIRNPISAIQFRNIFDNLSAWRGRAEFSQLMIEGTHVRDIYSYPDEQRGKRFAVAIVLQLYRNSYAPACGIEMRSLVVVGPENAPQPGELTTPQVATLIGCSYSGLRLEVANGGGRLAPYLLLQRRIVRGKAVVVFDEARIKADLSGLQEAFGHGGTRLPPRPGELTLPRLASLIGISIPTLNHDLEQESSRLEQYRLPQRRIVSGLEVPIFDEEQVRTDLASIQESFGLGGNRLPPQTGELTTGQLANLVSLGHATPAGEVGTDGRLTKYLLPHRRFMNGTEILVFDEEQVRTDLASIQESFGLGGNRLPPQTGELTPPQTATLIGISATTVRSELALSNGRLTKYLLPQHRILSGKDVIVLDEALVRADLTSIQESFGLGGNRLPPQTGELTTRQTAKLLNVSYSGLNARIVSRDNRLTDYILPTRRIVKGVEIPVFDASLVQRDLEKLKKLFKKAAN